MSYLKELNNSEFALTNYNRTCNIIKNRWKKFMTVIPKHGLYKVFAGQTKKGPPSGHMKYTCIPDSEFSKLEEINRAMAWFLFFLYNREKCQKCASNTPEFEAYYLREKHIFYCITFDLDEKNPSYYPKITIENNKKIDENIDKKIDKNVNVNVTFKIESSIVNDQFISLYPSIMTNSDLYMTNEFIKQKLISKRNTDITDKY